MTTKDPRTRYDTQIKTLFGRDVNPTAIARELGISRHTVVKRLAELGLHPAGTTESQTLTNLRALHAARKAADAALTEGVAASRQNGDTWEQIGAAIEMQAPNAHAKFSKLIEEVHITKVKVRQPAKATKR